MLRAGHRRPAHALRARQEVQRSIAVAVGRVRLRQLRARPCRRCFRRSFRLARLQEVQTRAATGSELDRRFGTFPQIMRVVNGQGRRPPVVEERLCWKCNNKKRVRRAQNFASWSLREHDHRPDGRSGPGSFESINFKDATDRRAEARNFRTEKEDRRLHGG